MMLEKILPLILLLGRQVELSLLVGYIFMQRKVFFRMIFLFCYTVIYNFYLKNIFQYPLPQDLAGFALPSSHAHILTIFFAGLFIEYRKNFILILALVFLPIYSYALIWANYHYLRDILAAYAFAIPSIGMYYLWVRYKASFFPIIFLSLALFFHLHTAKQNLFCLLALGLMPGIWLGTGIQNTSFAKILQKNILSLGAISSILTVIVVSFPLWQPVQHNPSLTLGLAIVAGFALSQINFSKAQKSLFKD